MTIVKHEGTSGPISRIRRGFFDDPAFAFGFVEHFLGLNPTADDAPWLITDGDSGASAALIGSLGGLVRLTTGVTDNNECYMGYGGTVGAGFEIDGDVGSLAWEIKFRLNTAISDQGLFIGLTDANAASANMLDDDTGEFDDSNHSAIGFRALAAAPTDLDAIYATAGTARTIHKDGAQTLVADTWYRVGGFFDKDTNKHYWFVDGSVVDRAGVLESATNMPDDVALTLSFGLKTGSGNSRVMDVDYAYCIQELI